MEMRKIIRWLKELVGYRLVTIDSFIEEAEVESATFPIRLRLAKDQTKLNELIKGIPKNRLITKIKLVDYGLELQSSPNGKYYAYRSFIVAETRRTLFRGVFQPKFADKVDLIKGYKW